MLLERIRYFIETARQGSFSKAAKNMYISPQAMTKQISVLEDEIGGKLLTRSTQGITLTPLGEMALDEFSKIDEHVERVMIQLREKAADKNNIINIGIFSGFPHNEFVMPVISFLMVNYPQYQFKLQLMDVLEGRNLFLDNKLDLLLTFSHEEEAWPDSKYLAFSKTDVKVMVSLRHPWVMKEKVTIDDLKASTFVKMNASYANYAVPEKDSFYANIPCQSVQETPNSETLYMMLQQGTGFSVFPRNYLMKSEHLKAFDYPGKALTYYEAFVYHPQKDIEEIVQQIKEEFNLTDMFQE